MEKCPSQLNLSCVERMEIYFPLKYFNFANVIVPYKCCERPEDDIKNKNKRYTQDYFKTAQVLGHK